MAVQIKCKACRKKLFENAQISNHIHERSCSHLFLEIVAEIHADKINCPECNAKIGALNLGGMKCSCDEWIAPAFGLSLSKVDVEWEKVDLLKLRNEM